MRRDGGTAVLIIGVCLLAILGYFSFVHALESNRAASTIQQEGWQ